MRNSVQKPSRASADRNVAEQSQSKLSYMTQNTTQELLSQNFSQCVAGRVSTRRVSEKRNPWSTNSTKLVYENPWIKVSESQVMTPAKTPGIYGIVHFQNLAVGIVAIDVQDRILMVGQYRYPLREYSWELPEGGCPIGTSGLKTAKRELREETGYQAKHWRKLLELTLSNSSTDERAVIYEASDLSSGRAAPEETEALVVKWLDFSAVLRRVKSGDIRDAITVAAVLHVALQRASHGSSLKAKLRAKPKPKAKSQVIPNVNESAKPRAKSLLKPNAKSQAAARAKSRSNKKRN